MTTTPKQTGEVVIRSFTISRWNDDSVWISKTNDGEGMQVPDSVFEKLIADFYRENF